MHTSAAVLYILAMSAPSSESAQCSCIVLHAHGVVSAILNIGRVDDKAIAVDRSDCKLMQSKILFRRRRHTAPKYRARNRLIDLIKRIHDALRPGFVHLMQSLDHFDAVISLKQTHLKHELPHSILSLLAIRITRQHCTLSCTGRTLWR